MTRIEVHENEADWLAGESTASEVEYAEQIGKPIRWLESPCHVPED